MDMSKLTVDIKFDSEGFIKDLGYALNDEVKRFCHYNLKNYVIVGEVKDSMNIEDLAKELEFYMKKRELGR